MQAMLLKVKNTKGSEGATHIYYVYGLILDIEELGVSRERILRRSVLKEYRESWAVIKTYICRAFRNKIAYGMKGF